MCNLVGRNLPPSICAPAPKATATQSSAFRVRSIETPALALNLLANRQQFDAKESRSLRNLDQAPLAFLSNNNESVFDDDGYKNASPDEDFRTVLNRKNFDVAFTTSATLRRTNPSSSGAKTI